MSFDKKYERNYSIFNPINAYGLKNPLNPINQYDPGNPVNPLNQHNLDNPVNPLNQIIPRTR